MQVVKKAAKVELYVVIGLVAVFLVSAMLTYFCDLIFCKKIGYTVYDPDKNGNYVETKTVYYKDGEGDINDLTGNSKVQPIREEMGRTEKIATRIFIFLINLLVFYFCIYLEVNGIGRKARFGYEIENRQPDKRLPVKLGLLADVPFLISYVALLICKAVINSKSASETAFIVYKVINIPSRPVIDIISGFNYALTDVSWLQIALMSLTLAVVPTLTILAYKFGYSNGEKVNSWIYKD